MYKKTKKKRTIVCPECGEAISADKVNIAKHYKAVHPEIDLSPGYVHRILIENTKYNKKKRSELGYKARSVKPISGGAFEIGKRRK